MDISICNQNFKVYQKAPHSFKAGKLSKHHTDRHSISVNQALLIDEPFFPLKRDAIGLVNASAERSGWKCFNSFQVNELSLLSLDNLELQTIAMPRWKFRPLK
ncbi:hypothetical protein CEXT_387851 [Caerostris extrusa]|uniref:Uncharacterized protein n=1 Tax=Caerostris extrusa TaxID=172846 RepID=A0AAV4XCY6_CAEEX|nr:hypothetical protein CEXT_387851 [Caerostris extrusa]